MAKNGESVCAKAVLVAHVGIELVQIFGIVEILVAKIEILGVVLERLGHWGVVLLLLLRSTSVSRLRWAVLLQRSASGRFMRPKAVSSHDRSREKSRQVTLDNLDSAYRVLLDKFNGRS